MIDVSVALGQRACARHYGGRWTTSGARVDVSLIAGLDTPVGIVVVPVPEPSTLLLVATVVVGLAVRRYRA